MNGCFVCTIFALWFKHLRLPVPAIQITVATNSPGDALVLPAICYNPRLPVPANFGARTSTGQGRFQLAPWSLQHKGVSLIPYDAPQFDHDGVDLAARGGQGGWMAHDHGVAMHGEDDGRLSVDSHR